MGFFKFFSSSPKLQFNSIGEIEHYLYDDPSQTEARIKSSEFLDAADASGLAGDVEQMAIERGLEGNVPSCMLALQLVQQRIDGSFKPWEVTADTDFTSETVDEWRVFWDLNLDLTRVLAEKTADPHWYGELASGYSYVGLAIAKMMTNVPLDNPAAQDAMDYAIAMFENSVTVADDVLANFPDAGREIKLSMQDIQRESAQKLEELSEKRGQCG